jgi:hypothetical protein
VNDNKRKGRGGRRTSNKEEENEAKDSGTETVRGKAMQERSMDQEKEEARK